MSRPLAAALRAYPTLLRIGLNEALAYRAEMLVWMLTTTMPLVNLALWHAVAEDGNIGRFGQADLVAYFLAGLVVRQLTGSWVVWEMNRELRSGTLSLRLLRPIHPLIAYSAENLAALPLRAAISLPIALAALFLAGQGHFLHDPWLWATVPLALVGAWLSTFLFSAIIGALGFFLESSVALFDLWLATFFALSGYLFPLEFLSGYAPWLLQVVHALPFYFLFGFPVELILGHHGRWTALQGLAAQWGYVAALLAVTSLVWRAGLRRWNAYGA